MDNYAWAVDEYALVPQKSPGICEEQELWDLTEGNRNFFSTGWMDYRCVSSC